MAVQTEIETFSRVYTTEIRRIFYSLHAQGKVTEAFVDFVKSRQIGFQRWLHTPAMEALHELGMLHPGLDYVTDQSDAPGFNFTIDRYGQTSILEQHRLTELTLIPPGMNIPELSLEDLRTYQLRARYRGYQYGRNRYQFDSWTLHYATHVNEP